MATFPLIPGPTAIPPRVLALLAHDYGSSDLDLSFYDLYESTSLLLLSLVGARAPASYAAVTLLGEGMLALWAGLKSTLTRDSVVCVLAGGVFGDGFIGMARAVTPHVHALHTPAYDVPFDPQAVRSFCRRHGPSHIVAVHVDTPSAMLHDVSYLGALGAELNALTLVDCVASAGGVDVRAAEWGIDCVFIAPQKALSAPPTLCSVVLSSRAQRVVREVAYEGYDALLPWLDCIAKKETPYTFDWGALRAYHEALLMLFELDGGVMVSLSPGGDAVVMPQRKDEKVDARLFVVKGLQASFERHLACAELTRARITAMGMKLYGSGAPTVTAVYVPDGWTWAEWKRALELRGVRPGGSWGKVKDVVWRIGHMGVQADVGMLGRALDVIEEVLHSRSK